MTPFRFVFPLALVPLLAGTLQAEPLPVETFFRYFQHEAAELSPDGTCVAVLAPSKNRVGLAIINLEDNSANWAYVHRNADVDWFRWVSTRRLVLGLGNDGYRYWGMLAVNKDGTKPATLVSIGDSSTRLLATLPDFPDEILVSSLAHAARRSDTPYLYPNVERMNLFTGKMTMAVKNPGQVVRWVLDHKGAARIGMALTETRLKILHRAEAATTWEVLAEFGTKDDGFWPVGFEPDNRTLLVAAIGDGDTEALYTYDVTAKRLKDLAFRHAEADLEHVIVSPSSQELLGATYETERREVCWFDEKLRRVQACVDRALTNTINRFINCSHDRSKALFLAASDRTPGTYYLMDTTELKLRKLFDRAEWVHAEEMAEMKPIEYDSRDGLRIHGYLTLPKGSSGKNLPMIVNPHGGPAARDSWGYDAEVQFLANRGYAVLQVNFRGSTGYGRAFYEAGFRQWGLKQQDDITDGVRWAIQKGIADAKRIAIYGSSYGGLAALVGLEKTPELYRCGISLAGVTDVRRTLDRFAPNLKMLKLFLAETVGDVKKDKLLLQEVSPVTHVEQIQVPVFLANGELDPRVPIATGRAMARALKKRGKLYDFMVRADEGHGFYKEANRIEFWKKVDAFLQANLN